MATYTVKCTLTPGQVFVHGFAWVLVIAGTFGLGLILFPFGVAKTVLNSIEIEKHGE